MPLPANSLYFDDSTEKLYGKLADLEEKLLKSEAERKRLENMFQHLSEQSKNEDVQRLKTVKEKYTEFLSNCRQRDQRNEAILKKLHKVETSANAVFAKTERLKQLRVHYDAYLTRVIPLWRHANFLEGLIEQRPQLSAYNQPIRKSTANVNKTPSHEEDSKLWYWCSEDPSYPRHGRWNQSDRYQSPGILSLGLAGQRMIRELDKLDNYPSVSPVERQRYLPKTMIYPQNNHGGNYNVNPVPTLFDETNLDEGGGSAFKRVPVHSQEISENARRAWQKIKDNPSLLREFIYYLPLQERSSKESFEIECLAESSVIDEDHNLSDDEVLDGSLYRKQHSGNNDSRHFAGIKNNQEGVRKLATSFDSDNVQFTNNNMDNYGKNQKEQSISPVTKRSVIAHQKSIEELKAMLSFEEEEPDMAPCSNNIEDEDVPEEFTEQISEDLSDTRRKDVLRNVILEEDEPDENDGERLYEGRHKRKDWGRVQYNRGFGKSAAIQSMDHKLSDIPNHPVPKENLNSPYNSSSDVVKMWEKESNRSESSRASPVSVTSRAASPKIASPESRKTPPTTKENSRDIKSKASPSGSPTSGQRNLRQGRSSPLQHSASKQSLLQRSDSKVSLQSNGRVISPVSSRGSSPHVPTNDSLKKSSSRTQSPLSVQLTPQQSPARSVKLYGAGDQKQIPSPSYDQVEEIINDEPYNLNNNFVNEELEEQSTKTIMDFPGQRTDASPLYSEEGIRGIGTAEHFSLHEGQNILQPETSFYAGEEAETDVVYGHYNPQENINYDSRESNRSQDGSAVGLRDEVTCNDTTVEADYGMNQHYYEEQHHNEPQVAADEVENRNSFYQHAEYEQYDQYGGHYDQQPLQHQEPSDFYENAPLGFSQHGEITEQYNQYDSNVYQQPELQQQFYNEAQFPTDDQEHVEYPQNERSDYYEEEPNKYDDNYYNVQSREDFRENEQNYDYSERPPEQSNVSFRDNPIADESEIKKDWTQSDALPPKQSILSQLLDSDSESYRVEPASAHADDSDFDFSLGKQ